MRGPVGLLRHGVVVRCEKDENRSQDGRISLSRGASFALSPSRIVVPHITGTPSTRNIHYHPLTDARWQDIEGTEHTSKPKPVGDFIRYQRSTDEIKLVLYNMLTSETGNTG